MKKPSMISHQTIFEQATPGDDHMNYLQALVRVKAPGQVQEFQPLLDEMYDLLGRSNLEAGTLNKYESLLNSHRWLKKAVAEALIAWFI